MELRSLKFVIKNYEKKELDIENKIKLYKNIENVNKSDSNSKLAFDLKAAKEKIAILEYELSSVDNYYDNDSEISFLK